MLPRLQNEYLLVGEIDLPFRFAGQFGYGATHKMGLEPGIAGQKQRRASADTCQDGERQPYQPVNQVNDSR